MSYSIIATVKVDRCNALGQFHDHACNVHQFVEDRVRSRVNVLQPDIDRFSKQYTAYKRRARTNCVVQAVSLNIAAAL